MDPENHWGLYTLFPGGTTSGSLYPDLGPERPGGLALVIGPTSEQRSHETPTKGPDVWESGVAAINRSLLESDQAVVATQVPMATSDISPAGSQLVEAIWADQTIGASEGLCLRVWLPEHFPPQPPGRSAGFSVAMCVSTVPVFVVAHH